MFSRKEQRIATLFLVIVFPYTSRRADSFIKEFRIDSLSVVWKCNNSKVINIVYEYIMIIFTNIVISS